jgi:hypothetical protein
MTISGSAKIVVVGDHRGLAGDFVVERGDP